MLSLPLFTYFKGYMGRVQKLSPAANALWTRRLQLWASSSNLQGKQPSSTFITSGIGRTMFSSQPQSEEENVLFHERGSKKVITFNRPAKLNAVDLSLAARTFTKLKGWNDDSSTSLVITKGAGDRAYCAGGDIKALMRSIQTGDPYYEECLTTEYNLLYLIGTLRPTYVALIDGVTMGCGGGLSMNGQFQVATENTVFAMPETAIGLFPDCGGSNFLSRCRPQGLGTLLALTAAKLKGKEVWRSGLASHYVLSKYLTELEEELLSAEPCSGSHVLCILNEFHSMSNSDDTVYRLEPYLSVISDACSRNSIEEIINVLLEDGRPWVDEYMNLFQKVSPTSLKVTLEQMKRGRNMSLRECLEMEYGLLMKFKHKKDFCEGIRALVVDKDNKPRWDPDHLDRISHEAVLSYFDTKERTTLLELGHLPKFTTRLNTAHL